MQELPYIAIFGRYVGHRGNISTQTILVAFMFILSNCTNIVKCIHEVQNQNRYIYISLENITLRYIS